MALAIITTKQPPLPLNDLADAATEYGVASHAKNTRRAYDADLRDFTTFCDAHGENALPATPQTVALYLAHLAETKKVATILRRLTAIAQSHKDARLENPVADPAVRKIRKGIVNRKGSAQRKKDAFTSELLRQALLTTDAIDTSTLKGVRDRALLLLTFALAGRRSEVAALNIEDLRYDTRGLVVTIRRSKTDQAGAGREIAVPMVKNEGLCAFRAVAAWLEASKITSGSLFRTFDGGKKLTENRIDGRDVARLVKLVCEKAGITGDFSAHSLRAGFITTAASTKGVTEHDIQRVSGHKSVQILRSYVRKANLFENTPLSAMLGDA